MITISFSDDNILTLSPQGALTTEDFEEVRKAFEARVNETDKVPNLLIHPRGFPHWSGFHAVGEHLRLVQELQKVIAKIAVVSDSPALGAIPLLADRFVTAKIRHFPERQIEAARAWLVAEGDKPGRFELFGEDLPDDLIALKAHGIITSRDYQEFLQPLIQERLKEHDKLKFLFVLGEDFTSYSADAMWDDLRFGVAHWADFRRIAVVTDVAWIANATRLFGPLMPAETRVFQLDELDDAMRWIRG